MTETPDLLPLPESVVHSVHRATLKATEAIRLRSKPAGLVYHYCDANALLNIFNLRSIWATDTGYLNDSTELVSLFEGLKHRFQQTATPAAGLVRAAVMELAEFAPSFRAGLIGMSSYVACFSEDGDMLSQWRAYADDGMGFAIGFDPTDLAILSAERPAELRRMMYGGSTEEEIVVRYLDQVIDAVREIETCPERYGYSSMSLNSWLRLRTSEFLYEFAFECKHRAFHEEREWRILASGGELLFRASNGKLVPYKTLNMASVSKPELMPVREIVIGPCTNARDAERTLTYLADKLGYGHSGIRFRRSEAPYRR